MTIFVPSRGRPDVVNAFGTEFLDTIRGKTHLVFIIDEDDPFRGRYVDRNKLNIEFFVAKPSARGMNGAMNEAYRHFERTNRLGFSVGFMGDDHRPRTVGWDIQYVKELIRLETGFVYGDDLLQHERLPTQVAFTADIPRALGFMAPPVLQHLNIDTYWLAIGQAINRITYLPNVIVEHMHPLAGKATMDKNYRAVNSNMVARNDAAAYRLYHEDGSFARDVQKLEMLIETGWTEPWD